MTPEEERLQLLGEQQEAETLTAEQVAAAAATAELRGQLERLLVAAAVLWEATGDDNRPALLEQLRRRLVGVRVQGITGTLIEHFERALRLGVRQGRAQLFRRKVKLAVRLPVELRQAADNAEARAREEIAAGAGQLVTVGPSGDVRDVEDALVRARRSLTRVETAATWGVNRAVAAGVEAVGEAAGSSRVWVPERDACVHCTAYAGEVAAPGEGFPPGLTFGKKPLPGPVPNPPLHPNCRCRLTLWMPELSGSGVTYPDALKREAQRSIARGFSLESESLRVRLDAAERLLKQGTILPASVEDYARRAISRGSFGRGRKVPKPLR